jgi:hypothetical protein
MQTKWWVIGLLSSTICNEKATLFDKKKIKTKKETKLKKSISRPTTGLPKRLED